MTGLHTSMRIMRVNCQHLTFVSSVSAYYEHIFTVPAINCFMRHE